MNTHLQEISDLLHLQPTNADIYISILAHGPLSKHELQQLANKTEKEIEMIINELVDKDFIAPARDGEDEEIFEALTPVMHKEVLQNLQQFVLPKYQRPDQLDIMKYEGSDGIRKVYLEVLEEARKSGENILAFESGVDAAGVGTVFFDDYIKKRMDLGIKAYVITPDALQDREYKKKYEGIHTNVKLIPDLSIEANMNIVGSLVMTFTLSPPRGTLRMNKQEANTLKAIFHKLWDN